MHLSFAPVSEGDFEMLLDLRIAAMRESLERLGIFNLDNARKRFQGQFDPQYMQHICVDEGAGEGPQRAGLLTVIPEQGGRLKLQHLYLLPVWHNRRIGDWVMQQVQDRARRDGRAVWLEVLNYSDAIRFYERYGFVHIGGDPIDLLYQWSPAQGM